MSNIVYLKTEKNFYPTFYVFDKTNLTSIRLEPFECEIKRYDDLQQLNGVMGRRYVSGYNECDKSEFEEALNNFKKNLNLISDKL